MKTRLIITEDSFNELLKESVKWRGYDNFKAYQEEDDMEYLEFRTLKPFRTGVPVEILIDDGLSYQRHNHPLFAYFRNGYSFSDGFIPISISNNPQIMIPNPNLRIGNEELNSIKSFIRMNKKNIELVANKKLSGTDFVLNKIIKVGNKNLFESYSKMLLLEMPTIMPSESGLPVEIWVDGCSRDLQHGLRIKFKASDEQKYSRDFSSMSIEDEPKIFNLPKKKNISNKTIELIKKFVQYNKEDLINVFNGLIDYESVFLPNIVKVDKNGNPIYPSSTFEKPMQSDYDNDISNLNDFLSKDKTVAKGNTNNFIK